LKGYDYIYLYYKILKGEERNQTELIRINSEEKGVKKKKAERDEELYLTRWLEGRMREGK